MTSDYIEVRRVLIEGRKVLPFKTIARSWVGFIPDSRAPLIAARRTFATPGSLEDLAFIVATL
jgi:hypothetical protein